MWNSLASNVTVGISGTGTLSVQYLISSSSGGSPICAGGTLPLSMSFSPTLHIYTSGTSATETIPSGATTCVIECWGGGGGGGPGGGSGCGAVPGVGGSAGGYSRTSINVSAQNGKTFKYTVGAGGTNAPTTGGSSSVSAGTVTGFSTMTDNGGVAAGAGGGSASGGNQNNTTGASNTSGGRAGSTGTTGTVSGDGSPYGGGGTGGSSGSGYTGFAGASGAVVFYYT